VLERLTLPQLTPPRLLEGLTTDDLLRAMVGELQTLNAALLYHVASPEVYQVVTFPQTGARRAMPPGQSSLDFRSGRVTRADGLTENLSGKLPEGIDSIRSAILWFDSEVIGEAKVQGKTSGRFNIGQCCWIGLQFIHMDSFTIEADLPYEIYGMFSTLNFAPQTLDALVSSQERYGEITTVDAYEQVLFTPTGGTFLTDDQRRGDILTRSIATKVFFVHNTGPNDAEVNLRLRHVDGRRFIDSAQTGSALNIPSGDNARIENGTYASLIQFRARSLNAGSPSTLEVQYRGFNGVR